MRTKRKLMLTALLPLAGCLHTAAQMLVLHHADGTTTDVELFTQPQVKFQGDKVLITSTVLNMEYPMNNVLHFTYKRADNTAIGSVKENDNYSQHGNQLVFHGIKSQDKVAVYTATGMRVPITLTRSGDSIALPLSAIPSGVYLLNVNGKTSKFTRP